MQWIFNPPAASHKGGRGIWERLVTSCKNVLNIVLQNQVLADEVLLTAITEVESLVNSPPLTEASSDVDDLVALTPNHCIIGRATPNFHLESSLTRTYHAKGVGDKRKLSPLTF